MILVGLLLVSGMPIVAADRDTLCQGDYVAMMNDHLTTEDGVGPEREFELPPGTYDVTLVSGDDHHPDGQEYEQWQAVLIGGGEEIETGYTPDLPADSTIEAFDLDDDIEVTTSVTHIRSELLPKDDQSVEAVCAIFDVPDNEPPVADPDVEETAEDTPVRVDVLENDEDPEGGELTVEEIVAGPEHGDAEVELSGEVTYTPDADYNGTDTFTYEVCDPVELCAQAQVTITITPVNDAPSVVVADPAVVAAGSGVVVVEGWAVFSAGPDDESWQTPTFVVSDPESPDLFFVAPAVDEEGTLSFTPTGIAGSSSFTVVVQDSGGVANGGEDTSAPQPFTIIVSAPPNEPPVADPDVEETAEDTPVRVDVLENDEDPEGGELTVEEIVAGPEHGDAEVELSGEVTYTPDADYNGTDTFTYEVCDPVELCAQAQVTITITPVNDAPVANEDEATTDEDTPVLVDVLENDYDVDGNLDPESLSIESSPTHGQAIVGSGGAITYTPDADYNGTDTFTYRVCDTSSLCSDPALVTVTVASLPPDAVIGSIFLDENGDGTWNPGIERPPENILDFLEVEVSPSEAQVLTNAGAGPSLRFPLRFTGGSSVGITSPATAGGAAGSVRAAALLQKKEACQVDLDEEDARFEASCGAGTYEFVFDTVGLSESLGEEVALAAGSNFYAVTAGTRVDFVFVRSVQPPPDQRIEGQVWGWSEGGDSDPVPGVDVVATSHEGAGTKRATTDDDGTYSFDVTAGIWTVMVRDNRPVRRVLNGPDFDPEEPSDDPWWVVIVGDEPVRGLDFIVEVGEDTPESPTGTIDGIVWLDENRDGDVPEGDGRCTLGAAGSSSDEPGVADRAVRLSGSVDDVALTDERGCYSFEGLPPGQYSVGLLPEAGSDSSPVDLQPQRVTIGPDGGTETINIPIGAATGAIVGIVWLDENRDGDVPEGDGRCTLGAAGSSSDEPGVADRVVLLTGPTESTALTDERGCYSFEGLPPGQYFVSVRAEAGSDRSSGDPQPQAVSIGPDGGTESVNIPITPDDPGFPWWLLLLIVVVLGLLSWRVMRLRSGRSPADTGAPSSGVGSLDPAGGVVEVGDVGVRSPGLDGRVEVLEPSARVLGEVARWTGDTREVLAGHHVEVERVVELSRVVESKATALGDVVDHVGRPAFQLELPNPGPGRGQVVLGTDESGVLGWHFPRVESGVVDVDRAGDVLRYRVARKVTPGGEPDGRRGLSGAAGSKVLSSLVFPLLDPVFERVGERFARVWEEKKRPYRFRTFTPDDFNREEPEAVDEAIEWDRLAAGKALLFVHGTFSRAHTGFGELSAKALADLHELYGGRVFAFDHFTLSHNPRRNVEWFFEHLPDGVDKLDLDIVCHSRGGLVSRVLAEKQGEVGTADRGVAVDKVVFVGVPNAGTPLTEPKYVGDFIDSYTNLLNFAPGVAVVDVFEGLITVVKHMAVDAIAGLDGLKAMRPSGEFLRWLNQRSGNPSRYFAVAGDYKPKPHVAGWSSFAKDRLMDAIFHKANDLVVPTAGTFDDNGSDHFPIGDRYEISADEGVDHTCYFADPKVCSQLIEWLRS